MRYWDGDGSDTAGVVRWEWWQSPQSLTWVLTNTQVCCHIIFNYGAPGDRPVVGNWVGSGVDMPGVFRPVMDDSMCG